MSNRHQVSWAVIAGAAIGAAIGYLFFTDSGRRLRARLEPAVEELVERAHGWRGTVEKLSAFAAETGFVATAEPPAGGGWDDRGPQPH
jgi:hypothetical protein